ncbi:UbiA prenyltransferase family-domain-containing protein [Hypoxylon trugodes]|uniref:UbiA prenyltransferase family-domain-containing protein n=1 Tax=Hypoxylon trugodes TaxID=326681 RepID=UPI002198BE08|nr:UbiA prenyltransferase family-domain-containing protein [Hypoxylon trugodes]KAI1384891.1 UbiA prenyltransferase family-domain-containing protein [Hypoxylon trugodes]
MQIDNGNTNPLNSQNLSQLFSIYTKEHIRLDLQRKMKRFHTEFYDVLIESRCSMPMYIRTIWLFTYSDMKTIVFPQSIFGVMTAYAASVLDQPTASHGALSWVLVRYPLALFWTWSNLLPFDIFNQLSEDAIEEDRINKPWRPLPSGIVDRERATTLMLRHYIFAIIVSSSIGGLHQSLFLVLLGTWYNAGGGADRSFVIRNLINAAGILSFASGAMEVALGTPLLVTETSAQWIGILASVIFTTIQTQDLYDTEGDACRGRKTMPLVIGDSPTRWWTAVIVLMFSILCPLFWSLGQLACVLPLVFGVIIAVRTLTRRTPEADRRTFQFYNVWMVSIYSLPLIRYLVLGSEKGV